MCMHGHPADILATLPLPVPPAATTMCVYICLNGRRRRKETWPCRRAQLTQSWGESSATQEPCACCEDRCTKLKRTERAL